jgi:hypothetical protein
VSDLSNKTALVFDHGLGIPIAQRLSRDFKRVLYHTPWEKGFSTINEAIIGDGMTGIERCQDYWKVKNEVDLWVFPDIQHSGLQVELESQGRAVWGSREADRLELHREYFLTVLKGLGLQLPKWEVCVGISNLREHLKDKEDKYVKISKYRGSLETKHFRSWKLDENLLDLWAVRFGAARHHIRFLVFDAINTPLEIGADSYNIRGQWPSLMLHGIEKKDEAYLSVVTKRSDMPDFSKEIMDAFAPVLEKERYANEWSMEIRVKDGIPYFLDPTTRLGLPSTATQLEIWENWSEIVMAGAHGEMTEPKPTAKFSAELILKAKCDDRLWPTVEIPNGLSQWCKVTDCCADEGVTSWPREGGDDESAGWLLALGDTPTEVLETMKEHVKMLPEGLCADIAPLADVIKEIEQAESKGIEFAERMPEPAVALE